MSVWCQYVLGGLWNAEVCFQPPSSLIGKVLTIVMPFCVCHTPYRALCRGQGAIIVQIDFSVAFDGVNHLRILFRLCSVGVGGSVMSVLSEFLSNRSQYVVVDDCRSKMVNVKSEVP